MLPGGPLRLAELIPVTPSTAGFDTLKLESLAEGHNMLARFEANWASGANRFDQPGEIFLGATVSGRLAGVGGLNVDPYDPEPGMGRVRHLYVSATNRRQGIGLTLVNAIIASARGHFRCINTNAPSTAYAFYEGLSFRRIDGVADVTHRLYLS